MSDGFGGDGFLDLVDDDEEYVSMLTVEDGSVVLDADTFVDIAFVTSYAALTGQSSAWTGLADDTTREQAIFRAMQTIINMENRFIGFRVSSSQTLPFPRWGMVVNGYEVSSSTIPLAVKQAQAELAIREGVSSRATMPDETFTEGQIAREDKQIGQLRKSVSYVQAKGSGKQPYYPSVMALLRPYLQRADVLLQY